MGSRPTSPDMQHPELGAFDKSHLQQPPLQLVMAILPGPLWPSGKMPLMRPPGAHLKIAQPQTTTLRNCELLAKMVVLELATRLQGSCF
jgi:hypothetical protein